MRKVKYENIRKIVFRFLLISFFSIVLFNHSYAGPDDDDDGSGDPGDGPGGGLPDPDIPLDGGVVVLIAAGVGYGIKKMVDARQLKRKNIDLSSDENLSETAMFT